MATLGLVLLGQIASFVVGSQTPLALAEGAGNIPASTQANLVLGQSDFTTSTSGPAASGGLKNPQGAAFDKARNRLYVVDTEHSRVLWYNNASGLANNALPGGVIGQPDLATTTANQSGGAYYPTAQSLAFPTNMAVDSAGNLAICDGARLLIFAPPAVNYPAAIIVLGQLNFTSINSNGIGPNRVACEALGADSAGNLYSGYAAISRVAIFKSNNGLFTGYATGQNASAEIGQPNFTTQGRACTATGLQNADSLAFDSQNRLYVGNGNRITWYTPGGNIAGNFTNGQAASGVLGKTSFTDCNYNSAGPTAANFTSANSLGFDSQGNLVLSDSYNYRMLRFTAAPASAGGPFANGQSASGVLGQTSFTTKNLGGFALTAGTLCCGTGAITFDSTGQLYFADGANRVTRYNLPQTVPPAPVKPAYFHNLPAPARLYDSRPSGSNPTNPPLGVGQGAFNPGESRSLNPTGKLGIPTTATAILANISVVSTGVGAGYVTAYPTSDGNGTPQSAPLAATLAWSNPTATTIVSNFATIPLDPNGSFNLLVGASAANLIVDVVGYLDADTTGAGTGVFKPVSLTQPTARLYDSRPAGTNAVAPPLGVGAGPLASGATPRTIGATGQLGIPSTASAVIINVSAVNATGAGFFSLYPAGGTPPVVAALTWIPTGLNSLGNLALVPLSTSGQLSFAVGGAGQAEVLMDVVGYIDTNTTASSGAGAGLYTSLASPARLYDTRPAGVNPGGNPPGTGSGPQLPGTASIRTIGATGQVGIPATAKAIVVHITLIDVAGPAFVGYYASGVWPGNSSVNSTGAGQIVGNLAIVPLDAATGTFKSLVGANSLGQILDVIGYIQ